MLVLYPKRLHHCLTAATFHPSRSRRSLTSSFAVGGIGETEYLGLWNSIDCRPHSVCSVVWEIMVFLMNQVSPSLLGRFQSIRVNPVGRLQRTLLSVVLGKRRDLVCGIRSVVDLIRLATKTSSQRPRLSLSRLCFNHLVHRLGDFLLSFIHLARHSWDFNTEVESNL